MRITKAKLREGLSYPLKSSDLEASLRSAGVTLDTSVSYDDRGRQFFHASFIPAGRNVPHERLTITVCAVPSAAANDARQFMTRSVIPDMIAWIRTILTLPANSPVRCAVQWFDRQR